MVTSCNWAWRLETTPPVAFWNRPNAGPLNSLRRSSDGKSRGKHVARDASILNWMGRTMSQKTSRIDIAKALIDPASEFSEPREIVGDPALQHDVKLRLLRQWERDARGLAVAEEEGMSGGEESMLGRVRHAIQALGEDEFDAAAQLTKHGS
jgi:hypothetical protein